MCILLSRTYVEMIIWNPSEYITAPPAHARYVLPWIMETATDIAILLQQALLSEQELNSSFSYTSQTERSESVAYA